MPTKGNVWRITSTIPYDIIQKGCIKENYERAKKRKISQAVQRETPLRSRFPFSLSVLLRRVLDRAAKRCACISQAPAKEPFLKICQFTCRNY